ncbi:MAG: hypothetical protein Q7J68_04630 [Thermoplasmata archaeon]|nr:hypothetical protein [Thermoplasmata archaeon]
MEFESSVKAMVSAERGTKGKGHALEDILYIVMGEASLANAFVMICAMIFFATIPLAMIFLFGAYSGGMRWLITLGTITVMGFVAIYLMKRGTKSGRKGQADKKAQTIFPGELTGLTETVERGAAGYAYSQQVIRERLCESSLNKLGLARDLDLEEMIARLDRGEGSFVGDEVLARFIASNRRGTENGGDQIAQAKGKSAERGRKFMIEIEDIIKRMEATV